MGEKNAAHVLWSIEPPFCKSAVLQLCRSGNANAPTRKPTGEPLGVSLGPCPQPLPLLLCHVLHELCHLCLLQICTQPQRQGLQAAAAAATAGAQELRQQPAKGGLTAGPGALNQLRQGVQDFRPGKRRILLTTAFSFPINHSSHGFS